MKFWTWLAWLGTAAFVALLAVSWIANAPSSNGAEAPQEPPPAPVFH
jgi:hypothetical protein